MAKILLSWLATFNDFKGNSLEVETTGPHYQLYETYFKQVSNRDFYFENHILFHSEPPKATTQVARKGMAMAQKLKADFREVRSVIPHHELQEEYGDKMRVVADVELVYTGLKNIVDLKEVYDFVQKFLQHSRFQSHEVYFLCGTGTAAMQTAFILAHQNLANFESSLVFSVPQRQGTNFTESVKVVRYDVTQVAYQDALSVVRKRKVDEETLLPHGSVTKSVFDKAEAIASHQKVDFLILGETGVGKEVLARHIYECSGAKGKFVTVNCAAVTESLLESELFGHIKGAFTDATQDRKGYFEEANGGTIFLDEIGDISPKMQVALLRVLQERKVMKVGSNTEIKVKVNIIAATNRNLEEMVEQGKFREDLYYRLTVVTLELPPLRERSEQELKAFITYFMKHYRKMYPKAKRIFLHKKALQKLLDYDFSGNIRELKHLIEQLTLAASNSEIKVNDLPPKVRYGKYKTQYLMEYACAKHTHQVYKACREVISKTAQKLGKAPNTVKTYLKVYQVYSHIDLLRAKYRYEDARLLEDLEQWLQYHIESPTTLQKLEACLGEETLEDEKYMRELRDKLQKLHK